MDRFQQNKFIDEIRSGAAALPEPGDTAVVD